MLDDIALLRKDWRIYRTAVFLFGFGFAVYNGLFQNYFRSALSATPQDLGQLESLRELPGLLAALTAGSLILLAESRVATIGLAITAVGIGSTSLMHTKPSLIAVTVVWSAGFHLYSTVADAITLALARGEEGGKHLGRMGMVGATATISALLCSFLTAWLLPNTPYNLFFICAGLVILVAAGVISRLSPNAQAHTHLRFVIRKEYWLYYVLTFLEGCRRQIFSIFATFTLITVFHQDRQQMLALQLINSVLIAMTAPRMGRLVDRLGERKPLTAYALGLIIVFIGYSQSRVLGVLYGLYIVDNVLFTFGVGFTTYLHRIARPGEFRPCLAMGVTMNHIAAVTVPFFGAMLWEQSHNYQLPFMVGVGIACLSLVMTRFLPSGPVPKKSTSE